MSEDKKTLKKLEEFAQELLEEKVPWHERNTLLRAQALENGLAIRDNELMAIVHSARKKNRGSTDGVTQDDELYIPDQKWACEPIIAANTFNLVVALQKVGKSSYISGLISSWHYGIGEFLGNKFYDECPPVIIVGTDQPLCDWREILVPAGLMEKTGEDKYKIADPVKKLWHLGDPVHLDDQGIEKIANEANKYKGMNPLVFADAYGRLVSPLGLNEGLPEAAEPINSLCEALAESGATLVLLHHASKSRSHERASNASRGGNALSAAASQIIQLHWLNEENKSDQRIALTTEGRNSKPVDLVIEQIERSQWISHGSKADIDKELQIEKIEEKLSDRQSLVYELVNSLKSLPDNEYIPLDSVYVSQTLSDEFGAMHGHVKALSTLNQLHNIGLIKKKTFTTVKRGNVAIFFLRSWDANTVPNLSEEKRQFYQMQLDKLRGVI